ncbi:hypothetical protein ACWFRC_01350 [Bacillus cereus]
MQIKWHEGYAEITGDEREMQRATVKPQHYYKNSNKCTVPTDAELNSFWEKAWVRKTVDAANVYMIARQVYLNEYGKEAKEEREIKSNRIQVRRRRGELVE